MPKALRITQSNLTLMNDLSEWPEDPSLFGFYYVQDVQFPHGYAAQAIVTKATFDATFKIKPGDELAIETALIDVDYI
jgi:hypothetical protein